MSATTGVEEPKLPKELLDKAIKTLNEDTSLHPQLKKDVITMLISYYRIESAGKVVELQSVIQPVCDKIKELTGIEVVPLRLQ